MKLYLAIGIVVLFAISRAALLVISYDSVSNWEEPAFLFGATELLDVGLGNIFDYRDDLNHGSSVALLALAVPWVGMFGTSLVTLKALAVVWSTLALAAMMAVARRYFSANCALLVGLFYATLSPTLARLDVTLVGSHPEALLPYAIAAGAYLESVRRVRAPNYAPTSPHSRFDIRPIHGHPKTQLDSPMRPAKSSFLTKTPLLNCDRSAVVYPRLEFKLSPEEI